MIEGRREGGGEKHEMNGKRMVTRRVGVWLVREWEGEGGGKRGKRVQLPDDVPIAFRALGMRERRLLCLYI